MNTKQGRGKSAGGIQNSLKRPKKFAVGRENKKGKKIKKQSDAEGKLTSSKLSNDGDNIRVKQGQRSNKEKIKPHKKSRKQRRFGWNKKENKS